MIVLQTQVNSQKKDTDEQDNGGGSRKRKFGRETPDNPNFSRNTTDQYC